MLLQVFVLALLMLEEDLSRLLQNQADPARSHRQQFFPSP
jgi:hypothetical protein